MVRSLNAVAQARVADAIQKLGKALPCSVVSIPVAGVPIFTVKFEVNAAPFTLPNVTVPMFGPEWIRYPIAVGTKGVVFPADASLGGMSGLGSGVADLTSLGNLSSLVFFPIANADWAPSPDPQALWVYGPNGVVISDPAGLCSITLTPAGIQIVGNIIHTGNINISGNAVIAGALSAASAAITGAITAASGTFTGAMSAASLALSGALTAASAALTGALTSATAAISGVFSAAAATVASLHSTGAIQGDTTIVANTQVSVGSHTLTNHTHVVVIPAVATVTSATPTG